MRLRESVEGHPLFYMVSLVISVAAVVAGSLLFLMSQRLDIVRSNYDLELTKIDRDYQSQKSSLEQKLDLAETADRLQVAQLTDQHEKRVSSLSNDLARIESASVLQVDELTRQHEARVSSLKQNLVSIERRMGDIKAYFDVSKTLITRDQANVVVPASVFYQDDGFYAVGEESSIDWSYEQTTELKFYTEFADQDGSLEGQEASELLTRIPLHLWRNGQKRRIEGVEGLGSLFSFVALQRMPHEFLRDEISNTLGIDLEQDTSAGSLELADPAVSDVLEAVEALNDFYRADSTGLFLILTLSGELALATGSYHTELTSIQKKGNILYARLDSTFSNVVVDGEEYAKYYLIQEWVLFSTPSALFIVQTMIPTSDHRSKDFAWISNWFGSFAILKESL